MASASSLISSAQGTGTFSSANDAMGGVGEMMKSPTSAKASKMKSDGGELDITGKVDEVALKTAVPGPDGDYGFGGHCFPKDLSAIIKMTNDLKTTNNILNSAKKTNDKVRKNRDWESMKGRAIN